MKEALAGGVREPGGEGRGREGAGPESGAGPGAVVVAGAEARGAGRSGSGHPLRVPWRGGFGFGSTGEGSGREGDLQGEPAALDPGHFPPRGGPSADSLSPGFPLEPAGPPGRQGAPAVAAAP